MEGGIVGGGGGDGLRLSMLEGAATLVLGVGRKDTGAGSVCFRAVAR